MMSQQIDRYLAVLARLNPQSISMIIMKQKCFLNAIRIDSAHLKLMVFRPIKYMQVGLVPLLGDTAPGLVGQI